MRIPEKIILEQLDATVRSNSTDDFGIVLGAKIYRRLLEQEKVILFEIPANGIPKRFRRSVALYDRKYAVVVNPDYDGWGFMVGAPLPKLKY